MLVLGSPGCTRDPFWDSEIGKMLIMLHRPPSTKGPRLPTTVTVVGQRPLLAGCVPAPQTPTPSSPGRTLHPGMLPSFFGPQRGLWSYRSTALAGGEVVRLVPEVLDFLWYLWICIECILSNLAVQTRRLVVLVGWFFFPSSPLSFSWPSAFWVAESVM